MMNPMHSNYNTTNISFLDMCSHLRKRGIQNHDFMLNTIHSELLEIDAKDLIKLCEECPDPFATNYILDILRDEVKRNIWFFFRELLQVPVHHNETIQFTLTKWNTNAIFFAENNYSFLLESPRQTGRSLLTNALAFYQSLTTDNDVRFCNASRNLRLATAMEYVALVEANMTWIRVLFPHYNKEKIDLNGIITDDEFDKYICDKRKFNDILIAENLEYSDAEWSQIILSDKLNNTTYAESCPVEVFLRDKALKPFYINHILPCITDKDLDIYDFKQRDLNILFRDRLTRLANDV